jgi:hypothetical protein
MTSEELEKINFIYVPVLFSDRKPELMKFVPCIDSAGEVAIYRLTEYGWNMRDGMADNSPNNNLEIVCWLEKMPLFTEGQVDTFKKMLD